MVTAETVVYTEAWLGRTLGTVIAGVFSNSCLGTHPTFFLPSFVSLCGRDFTGKMAFRQSAYYVRSNVFWWAVWKYEGCEDFLQVIKEGLGAFGGFAV